MTTEPHACFVCHQTSREIPLLAIEYQNRQYWICPQHLPVLIHKPHELAEVLPGSENMQGYEA